MAETGIAEAAPIACTLGPNDARDRFDWIAQLNRDALQSYERRGRVLELRYAPAAMDRVRELMRREQECCSFLTFGLHEEADRLRLIISAPESAAEAADTLFEQFTASERAATGCGCASPAGRPFRRRSVVAGKAAGGVALVTAAGAVAACAVCVVPFALPAVVLAGAGGVLAWLDGAHLWLTLVAVAAVALAWLWVWRQSVRSRARPATSTLVAMGLATVLVMSAVFWPEIEPEILRAVAS